MAASQARLLSVLVENRPGVLHRVASMIRRRGFNIDSLSVGETEDPTISRMTITVHVGRQQAEQAMKQLSKLIDVIEIDDITGERVVAREMLLIKIAAAPDARRDILDVVRVFRGRIVDVAANSVVAEVTGSPEKVENFIDVIRPFGIRELARSGAVALLRGDDVRLHVLEDGRERDASPAGEVDSAGDMTGTV